jgi:protein tyrosine/serine phosphatase
MWHLHPATTGLFNMEYNLENGRVRSFVHDFEYSEKDASKISTYNQSPPVRRDWPLPVEVFWTRDTTAQAQQITWSESPDYSDAVTQSIPAESASYEIYNLIPGRTYYAKVEEINNEQSTVINEFSFTTTGQMRHLKVDGTANVRDLGGWPTACGRPIKYGKIFRGAEWNGGHNLEPEGIEALRQAGIKAELDLRSDSEAKNISKSVLGSDFSYRRIPLGQTASHMEGLNNSKSTYKAAFQYVLTCVKNDKPVYFHCAIGRDRTGTLAFLLEGVLGMSKSDIYKDYELTNFSYFNTPCSKGQLDEMFSTVEALQGETLEEKFRKYLTSNFSISNKAINDFRDKMLGSEEEVNNIQELENEEVNSKESDDALYDLSGRRMFNVQYSMFNELKKGIYIKAGKKVVMK